MNETLSPGYPDMWWVWVAAGILPALFLIFLFIKYHLKRQKLNSNSSWNDYFVSPPEYADSRPEDDVPAHGQDLFRKYLHEFWHKKSSSILKVEKSGLAAQTKVMREVIQQQTAKAEITKNFFLWDDGLIFCGFKLQGTDLRTANLYGAYLRDMLLRDKTLGGHYLQPLIFRDTEAYSATDMSSTFLKNDILHNSLADGADLGRFDLSGLYLRDIGLQGIDIENILKAEETNGDCFLPESYRENE